MNNIAIILELFLCYLLFLVILMTFLKMFPLKLDCMQMTYCYIMPFIRTKEECLTLREDLNTLQLWANKWQMMHTYV